MNSKKSLKASEAFFPKKSIIALSLFAWLGAWASSQVVHPQLETGGLIQKIKADIAKQRKNPNSFENLTQNWQKTYGSGAFDALFQIASDTNAWDSERYIALMSAAKMSEKQGLRRFVSFLKDKSWMIRGGTLRALSVSGNEETGKIIFPLLQDPALVVRVEAVEALKILRPPGTAQALLLTLEDDRNYHAGKAQWVPGKALQALMLLRPSNAATTLKRVLEHPNCRHDAEFKAQVKQALNSLI